MKGLRRAPTRNQNRTLPPEEFLWNGGGEIDRLHPAAGPEGVCVPTLRLLEEKVVESNIVAKVSDNMIGLSSKMLFSVSLRTRTMGEIVLDSNQRRRSSRPWKMRRKRIRSR